MAEEQTSYDDEIDLVELFQTIWDGKWTVVIAVALAVASVFGYQSIQPKPNFIATTEIKPITSVESNKYSELNALGFFDVGPNTLLNLYVEQLDDGDLFEQAFREYQVLNLNDFENEDELNAAITERAASIELLPPVSADENGRGEVRRFWTIRFKYNNKDKWKQILSFVDRNNTEFVQSILRERFETKLAVTKQQRAFELEDIQTLMDNAKSDIEKEMAEFKLQQEFELEDIQTQIDNAIADYDRKTADRLAFLREQAAIARALGVAKSTIEAQTFNAQNGVFANVQTETPFYLRGYEAIEKEINLIETREDKKAFVSGLFELEQTKRRFEQDRTLQRIEKNKQFLDAVIELEQRQREIVQNKLVERAEVAFSSTPIASASDFEAVSFKPDATDFDPQDKRMLMFALAAVLGGFIGVVYVLISTSMRKRKETTLSQT